MTLKGWGILVLLMVASSVSWGLSTKQKQIVALEAILAELDTHYGMVKYKEKMYNVTPQSLREKYTRPN